MTPIKPTTAVSKDASTFFYICMVVVVSLMIGKLFMSGYRLTADDIEFHQVLMEGWGASWEYIKTISFWQGRIVHFIVLPFSLIGAYYADNYYFRLFYTALYFLNFLLIASYISSLTKVRMTQHVFIILLSFHSLEYFHLAPNAYPLHTSIPVFLIISSRILLLKARENNRTNKNTGENIALALSFAGMMFSEYGFLFFLATITAELSVRMASNYSPSGSTMKSALTSLNDRSTRKDLFLVMLFLLLYFGFRWMYPSSYEGNQLASGFNGGKFFKTLAGHVYGGTSFPSFTRNAKEGIEFIHQMSSVDWIACATVFILTFWLLTISIQTALEKGARSAQLTPRLLLTAFIGIVGAVIVTVPGAMTGKYQDWCWSIDACIYLDSRISYPWIGISIASFTLLSVIWLQRLVPLLFASTAVSLLLASGATLTYTHNLRVERDMKDYVSAWDRAKALACLSADELKSTDLDKVIDPKSRVSHHLNFDMDRYWIKYLVDQNKKGDCGLNAGKLREFYPAVKLGKRLLTGKSGGAFPLLKQGWAEPDSWGTWSSGPKASIEIPILAGRPTSIEFEGNVLLSPTHPKQDVEVLVNGLPAARIRLTADSKGKFEVAVPQAALAGITSDRSLKLELHFPDAARPKDLGIGDDPRELAIGLMAITVR
jgi:hypothetical protein